jgi:hypothetical protein
LLSKKKLVLLSNSHFNVGYKQKRAQNQWNCALFKKFIFFYFNTNLTGRVNCTAAGRPFCLPTLQAGMLEITRKASLSKPGPPFTPLFISALETLPSLLITK